jgi:hypothetical protein
LLEHAGFAATKVSRTGYTGPDLSIPLIGRDLRCEVKSRGTGFRQLYSWIAEVDLLFVSSDRQPPLVIIPFALATQIARAAQNSRSCTIGTPEASPPANEDRRRPQIMTTPSQTPNAVTLIDGFDTQDPTASPIRGTSLKFKDGYYTAFSDRIDVHDNEYVVLDRLEGWQKLAKDCPPEYLMRTPGQPCPPQPHVDEKDWPLNLNNKPEHPFKYTFFLILLDAATGEVSTFSSSTIGGRIAVGQLSDQVAFMRRARPDAVPVIGLESKPMPTQFGGTKPRPRFRILSWRTRTDVGSQNLLTSTQTISEPTTQELLNDELPKFE